MPFWTGCSPSDWSVCHCGFLSGFTLLPLGIFLLLWEFYIEKWSVFSLKWRRKTKLVSKKCFPEKLDKITVDLRSVVFILRNITNTAVSVFYLYQSASESQERVDCFSFCWFTLSYAPVDKWLEGYSSEMFPLNKQLRENHSYNKASLFFHETQQFAKQLCWWVALLLSLMRSYSRLILTVTFDSRCFFPADSLTCYIRKKHRCYY